MSQAPVIKPSRRLVSILKIGYELENITGLLIRMPVSAQVYRIGGADIYPMVSIRKYVIDGREEELEVPYIPGSSLKGRMRSLYEEMVSAKLYSTDGKIWMHARFHSGKKDYIMSEDDVVDDIVTRCVVDEVFGAPAIHADTLEEIFNKAKSAQSRHKISNYLQLYSSIAGTRLLVDDAFPSEGYVIKLARELGRRPSLPDFLEEKSENRLDRVTSAADPRSVVRVKPHVEFSGYFRILFFDIDRNYAKRNLKATLDSMKLVEETYLGGSGSRGYGRVKFKNINLKLLKVNPQKLAEESLGVFKSVNDVIEKIDEIVKKIEELFAIEGIKHV